MSRLPFPWVQYRGFCAIWLVIFVFLTGEAFPAPPEYLASEQVAADSASDLVTPFDGFSHGSRVFMGEDGRFGEGAATRFPVLEELLSDAVLELAPRTYYFRSRTGNQLKEEWAAGGRVSLLSGWWKDSVRFGISGYTSQGIYTPVDQGGTGLLKPDGEGFSVLGEAYVEGKFFDEKLAVKAFRQELTFPFFNRNDSRMTPKNHEAYTVISDAIPRLRIGAGHITRMRNRDEDVFRPLSEIAGAEGSNRGVSLAGFHFDLPEEKGGIGAINGYGHDTFNTFYADTTYHWDLPGELVLNTAAQFTHQKSTGDELVGSFESHRYGLQAAAGIDSLIATVAYTSTAEGGTIRNPWGGDPSYNSVMIGDFDRAGEDAVRVGLSYQLDRIGFPGVSGYANYVQGDTPEHGPAASRDEEEFNLTLDFRPEEGPLEGIWLRLRHGWNEGLKEERRQDFRMILNYSKEF